VLKCTRNHLRGKNSEYLLDTSCWLEWYNETKVGKKIKNRLKNEKRFTASLVIGELRHLIKTERYFKVKAFVLNQSEIIPYDENISELAGQLKKDTKAKRIGWVDYAIAATAKVKNLTVCSTDHQFLTFKSIIGVMIFEK